jgi:hypothetical protein
MSTTIDFAERLKKTRGRDARGQSVATRFTKNEQEELVRAAEAAGQPLREWLRETLLREARGGPDTEPDSTFTEIVATRILLNNVLSRVACGERMTPQSFQAELDSVRAAKHGAARELKRQYAAAGGRP